MDKKKYLVLLSKAFELVQKKHVLPESGKMEMRKYSPLPQQPFWTHLMNTHNYLIIWGEKDFEILVAAVLHDIVEDTDIKVKDIEKRFTKRIARLVSLVTKDPGFTMDDAEKYYKKISQDEGAMKIKVMDRIDNLLTHSMYHRYNESIEKKIAETEKYILKMADKVGMSKEIRSALEYVKLRTYESIK